jgi:hypothetical protein
MGKRDIPWYPRFEGELGAEKHYLLRTGHLFTGSHTTPQWLLNVLICNLKWLSTRVEMQCNDHFIMYVLFHVHKGRFPHAESPFLRDPEKLSDAILA